MPDGLTFDDLVPKPAVPPSAPAGLSFDDLIPKTTAPAATPQAGPAFDDLVPKSDTAVKVEQEPGFLSRLGEAGKQGVLQSIRDFGQTGAAMSRTQAAAPGIETPTYAEAPKWDDLLRPGTLAEKTTYGLAHSLPSLVGGATGSAIGTAIGGGPEQPIGWAGGILGGAVGAGAVGAAQSIGPYYAAALKTQPDPDKAFEQALKQAAAEGGATGLSWAAFGWSPFRGAVKTLLYQAFAAQPAAAVAGKAIENVAAGKPADEDLASGIPAAIAGMAIPAVGHMIGRRAAAPFTQPLPNDYQPPVTDVQEQQLLGGPGAVSRETAAPPPSAAAPSPPPPVGPAPAGAGSLTAGTTIGLRYPNAPSRRATIETYFDSGNSVRLRFDDGSHQDFLTSEVTRDMTAPPPPAQPFAPAPGAGVPDGGPAAPLLTTPRPGQGEPVTQLESVAQMMGGTELPIPPPGPKQERLDFGGAPRTPQTPLEAAAAAARLGTVPDTARLGALGYAASRKSDTEAPHGAAAPTPVERLSRDGSGASPPVSSQITPTGPQPGIPVRTINPAENDQRGVSPLVVAGPQHGPSTVSSTGRPYSLAEFLARNGGVRDDTGELRSLGADTWHRGRVAMPRLVRPNGMSPDRAVHLAQEFGYFRPEDPAAPPELLPDHLYGALDSEIRGQPLYSSHDADILEARRTAAQQQREADPAYNEYLIDRLREEARELGIAPGQMTPEELLTEVEERKALSHDPHGTADAIESDLDRFIGDEIPWEDLRHEPVAEESRQAGAVASSGGRSEAVTGTAAEISGPGATPEPRSDAAVEKTPEGDQLVIPGAERSAKQAAQARDATGRGKLTGGQAPLNEGLFAKTPEKGLFEGTGDRSGTDQPEDRRAEFGVFIEAGRFGTGVLPRNIAAMSWVLDRGRETGAEHLVSWDAGNDHFIDASTNGSPNFVSFSAEHARLAGEPSSAIVVHHNHPSSWALSGSDYATLAMPGHAAIVAYGHDGHLSAATLSPGVRDVAIRQGIDPAVRSISGIVRAADHAVYQVLAPLVATGELPLESADTLHHEAIARGLDHAGLAAYTTSRPVDPSLQGALAAATQAAALAAQEPMKAALYPTRFADDTRPNLADNWSVQPERGLQIVVERAVADAGTRATGDQSRSRRGATEPRAGARTGTPRGLAQDRPRFPEQPETPAEGRDYLDNVADAMSADSRGTAPGTYARRVGRGIGEQPSRMVLGAVPAKISFPRSIASRDQPSAVYWEAVKRREMMAHGLIDDWRSGIGTYLGLGPAERDRVHTVEEILRLEDRPIRDDGRTVVVRNDGLHDAQLSRAGESFTLSPEEQHAFFERREMFGRQWSALMGAIARKFGWEGEVSGPAVRQGLVHLQSIGADKGQLRQLGHLADILDHMEGQRRNPYVPLMRFGDYDIAVTPKSGVDKESIGGFPKVAWYSRVESRTPFESLMGRPGGLEARGRPAAAQRLIAQLRERFPADKYNIEEGYSLRRQERLRSLDIPAIEKLMDSLQHRTSDGAFSYQRDPAKAAMVDELMNRLYEELKAGFKKRSRTVPGYDPDFARATGAYMYWIGHHIAELEHGDDVSRAWDGIQRHPDPGIRQFWDKWAHDMEAPRTAIAGAADALSKFGFYWMLAANPATMLSVATHGPLMGHATLSVGPGIGPAGTELYRALGNVLAHPMADATKGLDWNVGRIGATPRERAFIADMERSGELHSRAAEEMGRLRENQTALVPHGVRAELRRALDIASSTVSAADRMNRIAVALAAFRLGMNQRHRAAILDAWKDNEVLQEMVRRDGPTPETIGHFMLTEGAAEWGKKNLPEISRSAGGRIFFQFKQFQMRLLSALWKLTTQLGPAGKVAAGFMAAGIFSLAGIQGLPFVQDIEGVIEWARRQFGGVPATIRAQIEHLMLDRGFGQVGANMVLHGPVSTGLGVELTSRLGFGDVLSRPRDWADALGAVPSMIYHDIAEARARLASGQGPLAAATTLAPAAIKNPIRGLAIWPQQGVRSATGRVIMRPEEVTPPEQARKALGYTPLDLEKRYEQRDDFYRAREAGPHRHR